MCSKKLVAAIPLWLPFYETHYQRLPNELKAQLLKMSPATIDRYLKPLRAAAGKGRTGTKPGTLLRNQIPIRTHAWDVTEPGFIEADTVAHCGNSLAGDFAWSLTLTDYCSGWAECRTTWNKGAHGVLEQIKQVENSLPFPVKGFDCDYGSKFLNHHLWRYFKHRDKVVYFTRSRPYKKNDNAHVEQKNWTHVRQLFGHFHKVTSMAKQNVEAPSAACFIHLNRRIYLEKRRLSLPLSDVLARTLCTTVLISVLPINDTRHHFFIHCFSVYPLQCFVANSTRFR